ncbi:MAG: hypothetical protein ABIN57_11310 [Chitinophagaceae bacterium]
MEDKRITEEESLQLIQQMIQTAKKEQKDDGKGWIVWGWLIFLASLFTFFNLQWKWVGVFFFWNLFDLLSLLLLGGSMVKHLFGTRRDRVRTYTKDLFDKLNIGFIISLMLIIFSMNSLNDVTPVDPRKGFALLLGLYGFWILIYGAVLNFKPSIIGAYLTFAFAFASLFVNHFAHTMLLHAAAVLCGYIIPGHLANRAFHKLNP